MALVEEVPFTTGREAYLVRLHSSASGSITSSSCASKDRQELSSETDFERRSSAQAPYLWILWPQRGAMKVAAASFLSMPVTWPETEVR